MCFTQNRNFDDQCKYFFNTLDDILHQCFRKVRIGGNKIKKNEIQVLMNQKSNLKSFLISNKCKLAANMVNRKLEEVEEQLTKLSAERNFKLVTEYIGNLEDAEGRFNPTGMWRLKNKLLPREYDPPMAKKDKFGNLITAPEALKSLYLETYQERLKHREIESAYIEN